MMCSAEVLFISCVGRWYSSSFTAETLFIVSGTTEPGSPYRAGGVRLLPRYFLANIGGPVHVELTQYQEECKHWRDHRVLRCWPEFGQAGKASIPVKMLLNHQSGVAAIGDPTPPGGLYPWGYMVKALEKQEPFWEPGSMHGYHGFTFGWLVGEVVRRVSGKS